MVLRASVWVFVLRASALVALGASIALLSDYVRSDPAFCGVDSGCGAVRDSGFGYLPFFGLGQLPLPALGALSFSLLFAATLLPDRRLRARVASPLALATGAIGLGLIALQFYLGHFCYLCMIADGAALFAAGSALALRRAPWPSDEPGEDGGLLSRGSWIGLSTLAVLAPGMFPMFVQTSEVPGVIRALYRSDQVTVVEFFDFQCPHCRDLSPRLKALVDREGAHLRFGYTPLPKNEFARAAARASICAAEQGREMEVTGHFFQSRVLAPEEAEKVAVALVPDAAAFRTCLASKRPDERIARDTQILKDAEFVGLPTTYIGGTRILGAQDDVAYRDALARAKDGSDRGGLKPWTYWLGALALALGLVLLGRQTKAS